MNDLIELISTSKIDPQLQEDLVLLLPSLSTIEQLKIKKALELQSIALLKLIPIKHFRLLQELKNPVAIVEEEKPFKIVEHIKYVYDDFSWAKLIEQIEQKRPNSVAVQSLLKSASFLGESVVELTFSQEAIPYLDTLENLNDLRQLSQLDALHVSFLLDENPDQKILLMGDKIQVLMKKMSVSQKRGAFLLFLRSPLFYKYIFTGLSALNIQTDVPRKTLLNVMHQNDDRFLNHSQFEWCAKLVRTFRTLCVV